MKKARFILSLLSLKGWGPGKVYDYVKKHNFDYELCLKGLTNLSEALKVQFKNEYENSKETILKNIELGIYPICILDEKFSKKLYNGTDKCVFLYYKGNIDLLNQKAITIIGTRKPSVEFQESGYKVSKQLASKGYVIVSGLALGCDYIAHKSCLDAKGKTIAVLPSPIDNIQPASNNPLANEIVSSGGLLISEYGTGSQYSTYNFPARDRIQSLLSDVILVIQASDKSGTMIACKKNAKAGKPIYAIKGNTIETVEIKKYIDPDNEDDLNSICFEIN